MLASDTEGFGLTPLEAMKTGVPVVVRPSPAVREVCGDAAVYFEDRAGLEEAVRRIHAEPQHRAELVARGRERAAKFSWERCAEAHVAAYRRALGS